MFVGGVVVVFVNGVVFLNGVIDFDDGGVVLAGGDGNFVGGVKFVNGVDFVGSGCCNCCK